MLQQGGASIRWPVLPVHTSCWVVPRLLPAVTECSSSFSTSKSTKGTRSVQTSSNRRQDEGSLSPSPSGVRRRGSSLSVNPSPTASPTCIKGRLGERTVRLRKISDRLSLTDTFPSIVVDGTRTAPWSYVRKTANYQSNGPVTDVTSKAMTCYQLAGGSEGAQIMNVTAGQTIGYVAQASITHPGPLSFWMAKASSGETAASMTGDGPVWFKIYQDHPNVAGTGLTWPAQGP